MNDGNKKNIALKKMNTEKNNNYNLFTPKNKKNPEASLSFHALENNLSA